MQSTIARRLGFVLLLLLLSPGPLLSGAWTQKKGRFYFKLYSSYIFTRGEFNFQGDKLRIFEERIGFENASFRDFSTTAYFEYGLNDEITLVANLPFKALTSSWDMYLTQDVFAGSEVANTVGFSDFTLAFRIGLLSGPVVMSFQTGFKLPLGYAKRPDNDGAPLGTGEVDVEGSLLLGTSLYPLPVYATGGIGFRQRGGPLSDELLYHFEVGYNLGRHIVKINLDGIQNTTTPPDLIGLPVITPIPGGGGVLPSVVVGDQHITKISPSVIYNWSEKLAIQGEFSHILAGKNTISGTSFSLGFVLTN